MNCPSGKHNNYVPEEDSVITYLPTFKQECAQCVLEERNDLLAKNKKLVSALEYTVPILDVIGRLGHCAQGGEQTGNQMHVWEAQKIVKKALQ